MTVEEILAVPYPDDSPEAERGTRTVSVADPDPAEDPFAVRSVGVDSEAAPDDSDSPAAETETTRVIVARPCPACCPAAAIGVGDESVAVPVAADSPEAESATVVPESSNRTACCSLLLFQPIRIPD